MHTFWQTRYNANGPIRLMWSRFLAREGDGASHLGDEEIWAASVHLGCTQMTIRGHVVVARVQHAGPKYLLPHTRVEHGSTQHVSRIVCSNLQLIIHLWVQGMPAGSRSQGPRASTLVLLLVLPHYVEWPKHPTPWAGANLDRLHEVHSRDLAHALLDLLRAEMLRLAQPIHNHLLNARQPPER
jgi:hypothetical protein